jgi:biopolymer transport protein ExbD
MSWKLRHAGSPKAIEGLTLTQIVEGLADDKFDASDEVLGPGDKKWLAIDMHPKLEEIASEMDEARNKKVEGEDPEEQRIDMNPLIDVCLVLLVFFILATTMSVLESVLDIPQSKMDKVGKVKQVKQSDIISSTIMVYAVKEGGKTVVKLENKPVPIEDLQAHLDSHVKETRKLELIINAQGVEWETVVAIIDAAGSVGIKKVQFLKSAAGGAGAPAAPAPGG